jgi:hypothetical protein
LIGRWRVRQGFSFDDAISRTTRRVGSAKPLSYCAEMPRRAGGSSVRSADVIPFNATKATLHHQD